MAFHSKGFGVQDSGFRVQAAKIMRMEEFIINVYCLQWHASFAKRTDIPCFSLIIYWPDNCRFIGVTEP